MKISVADYSSLFHYFRLPRLLAFRSNGNDRMVENDSKKLSIPVLLSILNPQHQITYPRNDFSIFFSFTYRPQRLLVVAPLNMSCSSICIARQIRCQINMGEISLLNTTYNRFPSLLMFIASSLILSSSSSIDNGMVMKKIRFLFLRQNQITEVLIMIFS